ncbi:hypothetical protein [Pandoraea oxalativorans]|nr:hypothetical protein [Pandoraea oxalativorans]
MLKKVANPGTAPVDQLMPINAPVGDPDAMPVIPPDLQDVQALIETREALLRVPALHNLRDANFDGTDPEGDLIGLVELMLHAHFDDGHPLGTALAPRETALMSLARHLSPTGAEALRRSLDPTAPPNGFGTHLKEEDRWHLDGAVWYQDAKACLARGEHAQAAICFEAAAKRFAHVPGKETWVAHLHRHAGDAHAQADNRVAAVVGFIAASKLELAYALALTARVPPQPSDAAAALDAVTRATCDLAVAAAFYRALELPKLALVVGAVSASAFVDLGLCPQAAALLDEISDIWADVAKIQCQANQFTLAEAAVEQAVRAAHSAALAHWVTPDHPAAGHSLVKVCDYEAAAELFRLEGDHGSAGLCYLAIGQHCEAAVAAHRGAARPEQADAEAQRALAFYALARSELAKASEDPVNAPRYAEAAAMLFTIEGDHGSAGLCYLEIGQRCEAAVAAHRGAGRPEQAGAEARRALAFYALARSELAKASEDPVNAPRYAEAAAELFTIEGDHGSAGLCYLAVGQRCEAAVAEHRGAGRPEQAGAEAQKALAFYALARSELAKAREDPVDAPRYAEAAAVAQRYFESLLLSWQAP